MSNTDQVQTAETFRHMAGKDYRALLQMQDPMVFDVEIFGFHVQQAVEKGLKAWLSILNVKFPKKHDLEYLVILLKKNGANIPDDFMPLMEYTDFASTFRYDSYSGFEDDVDRKYAVVLAGGFLQHLDHILANVHRMHIESEDELTI